MESSLGSTVAAVALRLNGYHALGPGGAMLVAIGLLSLAWRERARAAGGRDLP